MFFKKSNKKEAFNSRVTPSGINVRCAIMHAVHVYHYGHLTFGPFVSLLLCSVRTARNMQNHLIYVTWYSFLKRIIPRAIVPGP